MRQQNEMRTKQALPLRAYINKKLYHPLRAKFKYMGLHSMFCGGVFSEGLGLLKQVGEGEVSLFFLSISVYFG